MGGKTGSGKIYHSVIPTSEVINGPFYYCKGGLEIDVKSMCIGGDGKGTAGWYATGQDGNNCLGRLSGY